MTDLVPKSSDISLPLGTCSHKASTSLCLSNMLATINQETSLDKSGVLFGKSVLTVLLTQTYFGSPLHVVSEVLSYSCIVSAVFATVSVS